MSSTFFTNATQSTPTSPTVTSLPAPAVLALRVVAGIFAAFVAGLIALIVIWSWWRSRSPRTRNDTQDEPHVDSSDASPTVKVDDDEESIVGIPELASKAESRTTARIEQYDTKLGSIISAIKLAEAANTPSRSSAKNFRKSLLARSIAPLVSTRNVDTYMLALSAISCEQKVARWNRYIPKVPSPLGPGIRRGAIFPTGTPWRKHGRARVSNKENLARYVATRPGDRLPATACSIDPPKTARSHQVTDDESELLLGVFLIVVFLN